MELEFAVVAENLAFPEGPVVMEDGSVLFVEVVGGTLKRAWGDGRVEVVATLGGGPNGAQIGPDGAAYICNNGGLDLRFQCHASGPGCEGRIERVDLSTGKFERVHEAYKDRPLSAPNDLVFDRTGGLWFTDFGKYTREGKVYSDLYYSPAGNAPLIRAERGAIAYNGIGLSADETRLFVADTKLAKLFAFHLEGPGLIGPAPGARGEGPGPPARRMLLGGAPGDVTLDSLAVTARDGVCVGTIGCGGISCFSKDGYEDFVPLPDQMVTNIAFGGPDMRTAYITCAGSGKLVRTRWPQPGLRLNFTA